MSYYHATDTDIQDYDHEARVREVLTRKIARLPMRTVVIIQEIASALEFGEPLGLVVTRLKLDKAAVESGVVSPGKNQVQPREGIDYDQIAAPKLHTKRHTDGPRA